MALKPITCPRCKHAVGWFDTAHYNIVKPHFAVSIFVLVAVFDCTTLVGGGRACGYRVKFDGVRQKRHDAKVREGRGREGSAPRQQVMVRAA